MADWKIPGMSEIGSFFRSATETAPKPVVPDVERRNRPFAERIVREAGRDTLRGHRIEVSCPGGRVNVIDRSRAGGGQREGNASVAFTEYQAGAEVMAKTSGVTARIRVDKIFVILPRDVTVTYNVAKDRSNVYGAGKTLREHEEAHVATGLALRNPAFVEDLFRGRLSYTSAVTGETVRFAGLSVPSEFVSSVHALSKNKAIDQALADAGTRIVDALSDAAIAYLRDVLDFIDNAENHGPPLPSDLRITPYRSVGGKLVLGPAPAPSVVRVTL
ncbi:MAG: hypothetical protein WCO25_03315 [Candidatus Uhrbacteria bacterium]